jgi:hypothetical protein
MNLRCEFLLKAASVHVARLQSSNMDTLYAEITEILTRVKGPRDGDIHFAIAKFGAA